MKRLLLSTLFLFFAVAAFAQKGAVSGTVLDADTGESVAGAVLEVAPVKTPDQKQYFTSGYKGAVAIPSLPYDEYRLTVSFLGYNNYETTFRVAAGKQNIGSIKLTNKSPHETQMVRMLKNLMKYPPSPAPIANIMIIAQ